MSGLNAWKKTIFTAGKEYNIYRADEMLGEAAAKQTYRRKFRPLKKKKLKQKHNQLMAEK